MPGPKTQKGVSSNKRKNEFAVEAILDSRVRDGQTEYFIKWENYSKSKNTWEPEASIIHKNLIREFNLKNKKQKEALAPQSNGHSSRKRNAPEEFEVEDILDSRRAGGKAQYLVKWRNFPTNQSTWEPEENITDKSLITKFSSKKKQKVSLTPRANGTSSGKRKAADSEEYEVEAILDSRRAGAKAEYLIKWKNYPTKQSTWEPEENVTDKSLVSKFNSKKDSLTPRAKGQSSRKRKATEEYEVEAVVDSRRVGRKTEYLIKWKNFHKTENTWEPEENITDKSILAKFNLRKNKQKAAPRPKLQGRKRKTLEDEFEVEEVTDVRRTDDGEVQYFIKWRNYPITEGTWEPEENVTNKSLIAKFNIRKKREEPVEEEPVKEEP